MAMAWKMIRSAISALTFVVPELGARAGVIQARYCQALLASCSLKSIYSQRPEHQLNRTLVGHVESASTAQRRFRRPSVGQMGQSPFHSHDSYPAVGWDPVRDYPGRRRAQAKGHSRSGQLLSEEVGPIMTQCLSFDTDLRLLPAAHRSLTDISTSRSLCAWCTVMTSRPST